uniref:Immunoglobulin domain-containing protein n=1 Tax=Salmo trutta TaxID=8032 RepID=A0A674EDF4_SALTR
CSFSKWLPFWLKCLLRVLANARTLLFISGNNNDSPVNLECLMSEEDGNYYNWIKIIIGQAPVLMLSLYTHSNPAKFFGEFNNTQFTTTKSGTSFVLAYSDARPSDMGMYKCAARDYDAMIFGKGVFLMHEGKAVHNWPSGIDGQSMSESVQEGESVTLNCTIYTEHGSEEFHSGITFTSDQCEKSPEPESPTQSCVYNLPKRNLSLSDAGTYYFAVVLCGQILAGETIYIFAQDADSLHYVALNLSNNKNRSRRQRSNMKEETVYSGIRQ